MSPMIAPRLASDSLGIKRWNGDGGPPVAWDGLRKDADLWAHNGDCNVYLFAKGRSRRGPSFQIPSRLLYEAKCNDLISRLSLEENSDSGYGSASSTGSKLELHVPVPDYLDRQESLQWHIATRNLFAWLMGKPLVGDRLGPSITRLLDQMNHFREKGVDNLGDLLSYLTRIGYTRVANRPDHALAMLSFAESTRLKDIWLNAFVHCVGMNEIIVDNPEFEPVSDVSKALIARAHLYMDMHIDNATKSLDTFVESELSSTHLGLSPEARSNLDDFRSFLNSYSVARYGYWPPSRESVFPVDVYRAMQSEFQSLYDYLVDNDREQGPQYLSQSTSGGMCVQQNIDAFNERHNFIPLPKSMPLIPQFESGTRRTNSHKSLRTLMLGGREHDRRRTEQARVALMTSSNHSHIDILASPLVQAYIGYENDCAATQGDDVVEARKGRWILVYCMKQMLTSILQAPPGMKEARSTSYPVCCSVDNLPPWKDTATNFYSNISEAAEDHTGEKDEYSYSPSSIQPDCQSNDDFHILFKHQVHPATRDKSTMQRTLTGRRPSLRLRLNPSRKGTMRDPIPSSVPEEPSDFVVDTRSDTQPSLARSPVAEAEKLSMKEFMPPPLRIRRSTLSSPMTPNRSPTNNQDANRNSLTSSECGSSSPPSLVGSSEYNDSNDHSDSETSSPVTPICLASAQMSNSAGNPELFKGMPLLIQRLRYSYEDEMEERETFSPASKAVSLPLDRLALSN